MAESEATVVGSTYVVRTHVNMSQPNPKP